MNVSEIITAIQALEAERDRYRKALVRIALGNPDWKARSEAIPDARAALEGEK